MAASAYKTVTHEATRISLFLMLYGREAIIHKDIGLKPMCQILIVKSGGGSQFKDFEICKSWQARKMTKNFRSLKNILIGNM